MDPNLILMIVCMTLMMAVSLVGMVLAWRLNKRMIKRFQSQFEYNELDCRHVDLLDLPGATREHFESLTNEITSLGFSQIGDHRIRSWPLTYVRRFISDDRRTFGELVYAKMLPFWPLRTYDFISVLADGTYLETGRAQQPKQDPRVMERFQLLCLPRATLEESHRRHCEEVDEVARSAGSRPLEFEPQQIREVANYGHQLVVWDRRFQAGRETDPPVLALAADQEESLVAAGQGA